MVMPWSRSSGALSSSAQSRARPPCSAAMTLVRAAVRVVLPWSTCPMVPTFTCCLPMFFLLVAGRAGPEKRKAPSGSRRRGLLRDDPLLLADYLISFRIIFSPRRAHDDDRDDAVSASRDDDRER